MNDDNVNDVFGGSFTAENLGEEEPVVTIAGWEVKILEEKGDVKKKVILTFEDDARKLWLNKGNSASIAAAYGSYFKNWVGKRIQLYVDHNVMFGTRKVSGVRVRVPKKTATKAELNDSLEDTF